MGAVDEVLWNSVGLFSLIDALNGGMGDILSTKLTTIPKLKGKPLFIPKFGSIALEAATVGAFHKQGFGYEPMQVERLGSRKFSSTKVVWDSEYYRKVKPDAGS
jgi:hypothetical protein